jgi:chemotaxis methyl-accepting protein methylase
MPLQTQDRFAHIQIKGVRIAETRPHFLRVPISVAHRPVTRMATAELAPEDYSLLEMTLASAGTKLRHYRLEALVRRLPACLRALRARDSAEACQKLRREPDLLAVAVDSLLIGVTQFLRDGRIFEQLQQTILPEILSRSTYCRALGVACSDGAELYSLDMCLAERGALPQAMLAGIDCRTAAIVSARRGHYSQQAVASVPAELRERYLINQDYGCSVHPVLREATRWAVADAFSFKLAQSWDLILCRNFAIYLDAVAAHTLWERLSGMLHAGGYLIVGKAERLSTDLVRIAPCVYRKPLR